MDVKQALVAFIQSEKIKSGLIWVNTALQGYEGLPEKDRPGADHMLRLFIGMVSGEVSLARNLTGDAGWGRAQLPIEKAMVMVNSKIAPEAAFHLTQALSEVTSIGQRAMAQLKEQGLI